MTGSGVALGIVAAVRLLPFVLLGPAGGVIGDRYNKRRLLFVTQSSSAAGAILLAILVALNAVTFPVLIVISLVLGCLTVFDNPARQSLISDLVPRETLANAVVLNSVSLNVARFVGSVMGGTLVGLVGIPLCFVINAATFVAIIVSLARMRSKEMTRAVRARGQVREGLLYAVRTPELLFPLMMLAVTGILAYEFPISLPPIAVGTFQGTAVTYGVMAAVMAGGAIIGGLVSASRTAQRRSASLAITAIG
ncbi:MFS transporter [Glaciihabitans sp. UYNi722]|uniref:MFS transporter n=1 Tax=Glaciihabitans sp. UYNi722 TaxID=3156344 RepID=UPI0033949B8F